MTCHALKSIVMTRYASTEESNYKMTSPLDKSLGSVARYSEQNGDARKYIFDNATTVNVLNGKIDSRPGGGPAVKTLGFSLWMKEGLLHRSDGPAVTSGSHKEYWLNGEPVSAPEESKPKSPVFTASPAEAKDEKTAPAVDAVWPEDLPQEAAVEPEPVFGEASEEHADDTASEDGDTSKSDRDEPVFGDGTGVRTSGDSAVNDSSSEEVSTPAFKGRYTDVENLPIFATPTANPEDDAEDREPHGDEAVDDLDVPEFITDETNRAADNEPVEDVSDIDIPEEYYSLISGSNSSSDNEGDSDDVTEFGYQPIGTDETADAAGVEDTTDDDDDDTDEGGVEDVDDDTDADADEDVEDTDEDDEDEKEEPYTFDFDSLVRGEDGFLVLENPWFKFK